MNIGVAEVGLMLNFVFSQAAWYFNSISCSSSKYVIILWRLVWREPHSAIPWLRHCLHGHKVGHWAGGVFSMSKKGSSVSVIPAEGVVGMGLAASETVLELDWTDEFASGSGASTWDSTDGGHVLLDGVGSLGSLDCDRVGDDASFEFATSFSLDLKHCSRDQ